MALDLLQRFLGGQPERQQDYADFLRRYQQDPSSISDDEAARRYRELMRNAPEELADEANQHGFGQLPPDQRHGLAEHFRDATQNPGRPFDGYSYADPNHAADPRNLGRMAQQAENQDPDLFSQLFGQNSPLGSTIGQAALAAGAAYLASRVMGGQGGAGGLPGLDLPGLGGAQGGIPGLNQREAGDFNRRA